MGFRKGRGRGKKIGARSVPDSAERIRVCVLPRVNRRPDITIVLALWTLELEMSSVFDNLRGPFRHRKGPHYVISFC